MQKLLRDIAVATTVFGISSIAMAEEKQAFRISVDVSMPAHKMYVDINNQARRSCVKSTRQSILVNHNAAIIAACQENAVNAAIKSLDLPKLTAIHRHVTDRDIKIS